MALGDVQVRGRTGAAVEVLVRAADRQVHPVLVQSDGQRARTVAQVPDGDRARGVHGRGEAGQVVEPARAVVDVVEQDRGGTRAERARHVGGGDRDDPVAGHPGRRGGDVPVGGERRGVDQDLVAAPGRQPGRGDDGLEDVHARRVADDDLAAGRPDDRRDAVADPLGRGPPAALVPGPDAQLAPLAGEDLLQPGRHVAGQRAERVAVEVDGVVESEQLAQRRQFVRGVERLCALLEVRHGCGPSRARGTRSSWRASPARRPRRNHPSRSWNPWPAGSRRGGRCASATRARRRR